MRGGGSDVRAVYILTDRMRDSHQGTLSRLASGRPPGKGGRAPRRRGQGACCRRGGGAGGRCGGQRGGGGSGEGGERAGAEGWAEEWHCAALEMVEKRRTVRA